MRRDEQRLRDRIEAVESLGRMLTGKTEANLLNDEALRYAVAQRLLVIGEAAARTTQELRGRHTSVPWADIVAFRNILVHKYFGIHWPIVWLTATEKAPELSRQIAEIVRKEFPDSIG